MDKLKYSVTSWPFWLKTDNVPAASCHTLNGERGRAEPHSVGVDKCGILQQECEDGLLIQFLLWSVLHHIRRSKGFGAGEHIGKVYSTVPLYFF